ncbi:DUF4113 domain-containing protein [Colwellia sp. M166]|nr:DUF4113 domain-containing protein [Colwellia sp. M166]
MRRNFLSPGYINSWIDIPKIIC